MKMKICRASALPVELEDLTAWKSKWYELFDVAKRVCGKDMLRLEKKLATIEKALAKRYPTVTEVDFCDTPEKMKALVNKYGNILAGTHGETDELVYVIIDKN